MTGSKARGDIQLWFGKNKNCKRQQKNQDGVQTKQEMQFRVPLGTEHQSGRRATGFRRSPEDRGLVSSLRPSWPGRTSSTRSQPVVSLVIGYRFPQAPLLLPWCHLGILAIREAPFPVCLHGNPFGSLPASIFPITRSLGCSCSKPRFSRNGIGNSVSFARAPIRNPVRPSFGPLNFLPLHVQSLGPCPRLPP